MDEILNLIESVSEVSFLLLHIRAVVFVLCGNFENLPVHSFNALIIPILRDCLPNYFLVFLSFDVYLILC